MLTFGPNPLDNTFFWAFVVLEGVIPSRATIDLYQDFRNLFGAFAAADVRYLLVDGEGDGTGVSCRL